MQGIGTDSDLFRVERKHIDYVANMWYKTRELIPLRESLGDGSWEGLAARVSQNRAAEIAELKAYEEQHQIDLAFYCGLYFSERDKAKKEKQRNKPCPQKTS